MKRELFNNMSPVPSEESGKLQGIAVELSNELFKRMNIQTELKLYPLKRALYYIKQGKTDGVMFLIKTPEREKYLHYSEPIMTIRGLIWSAADRKGGAVEFEHLEDLRPYKIGVTIGYSYGKEFDRILNTMNIDKASNDIDNYNKLLHHRIEIFAGNEIVAKGLFQKYPELQGKFIHSKKAFMKWVFYMTISKKSQFVPLMPDINKTIKKYTE